MVVVDKLTKIDHFIPMKMADTIANIAKIYIKEISRLHGIPKEIVSEQRYKLYFKFLERII
jgi:hypothetical protein